VFRMAIKVIKLKRLSRKKKVELAQLVIDEIARPEQTPAPKGAPFIFEVKEAHLKRVPYRNFWVIWDRFLGIGPMDRSSIAGLALDTLREGNQTFGIGTLTISEAKIHEVGQFLLETVQS